MLKRSKNIFQPIIFCKDFPNQRLNLDEFKKLLVNPKDLVLTYNQWDFFSSNPSISLDKDQWINIVLQRDTIHKINYEFYSEKKMKFQKYLSLS